MLNFIEVFKKSNIFYKIKKRGRELITYILFTLTILFLLKIKGSLKKMFIMSFLFSALRSGIGWDYYSYYNVVESAIGGDYNTGYSRFGVFWKLLIKMCVFMKSPQLLLVISGFINLYIIYYISKKEKSGKLIFFTFIFFPSFYLTSLSSIRSALALSIVMLGIFFLREEKIKKSILSMILATFMHTGAVISLLIPVIYLLKFKLKNLIIILFLFGLVFEKKIEMVFKLIRIYLPQYAGYIGEKREGSELFFYMFYLIGILFFLIVLLKYKEKNNFVINLYIIGCFIFYYSFFISATAYRVGNYFTASLIFIPSDLQMNFKNKNLIKVVTISLLVILFNYTLYKRSFVKDYGVNHGRYVPYKSIFQR